MSVVRDFERLKKYNLCEVLKAERASSAAAAGNFKIIKTGKDV